jgi:hypothetical protein
MRKYRRIYRKIGSKDIFHRTEQSILREIVQYLQMLENLGRLMFVRNNTGALVVGDEKEGKRFIRFGKKGSSDLIVFLKGGRTIFLEVKREKGRQSEAQREFERSVKALGFGYFLVHSLDDVICILSAEFTDLSVA